MAEAEQQQQKKSLFDNPLLSTKVKSAKVKIFPEGGLGYFIGPTLALLSNSILSSYLNRYMTDVLGLTGTYLTLLPVISVIFVVLGNILVGRLMDHSRTRAGKARPLILLSIPLSILALLFLFIFTPVAFKDNPAHPGLTVGDPSIATLALFAVGYNLWFAVAYPFYFTNHSALINLSTRNSKDRSLLATISNATALAAMGLTSMVLPFFVGLLFNETKFDKVTGAELAADATGENVISIVNAEPSFNAWRIFIIALIVITVIGCLVEYYFTRERITEESFSLKKEEAANEPAKKALPVKEQFNICAKDKFWWIMMGFFFLYQLGGMLKNVSQTYYCQSWFAIDGVYSSTNGGTFQGTLSIIGAIPTALGMVIVWPLANKIGKGTSIFFGAILAVIGGAIGFIAPDNFAVVTTSFVLKALGSTPAMYISLALLADVLDHQEALNGARTDGLTMTIYGAIMAGMTGIANGILNAALTATNYSVDNLTDPALRSALLWIFIGGETLCYVGIFILFFFMKVEKYSDLDHKAIEDDQRSLAMAKGEEYIPAQVRLEMEEEQSNKDAWEAEKAELKNRCEKKNLNYEEELKKLEEDKAAKEQLAAAKKQENEEKKAAAKKAKDDAFKAKLDAMSAEERAAYDEKQKIKEEKHAAYLEKVAGDFANLRQAHAEEREKYLAY
ncbi:MAG TPA: MFS transporter [Candidatus Enterosoma merdigallinarum]|nr:MFS transporter [Candidatus Enterosoma merdigallinarum]